MLNEREEELKKIIRCFDCWMSLKEEHINFVSFFFENSSAMKIGVYGYGKLGRHLIKEIREAGYSPAWIADRRAGEIQRDFKRNEPNIISPEEIKDVCDYVIVTTAGDMESIERDISERINTRVVRLDDMLIAVLKRKEML